MFLLNARRVSLLIPTMNAWLFVVRTKFSQAEHAFALMTTTELTKSVTSALKDITMTSRLWTANHCAEPTLNTEVADVTATLVSS